MQIFNKLEIIFQLPLPIMRNSIANLMKILGILSSFWVGENVKITDQRMGISVVRGFTLTAFVFVETENVLSCGRHGAQRKHKK